MTAVDPAENKYQWQAEMDAVQDYAYAQNQLRETRDFLYESHQTMPTDSRQHADFSKVLTHINEALSHVTFKNHASIKEWEDWSNQLIEQEMALEETYIEMVIDGTYLEDEIPFQSKVWLNMVDEMRNVAGSLSVR